MKGRAATRSSPIKRKSPPVNVSFKKSLTAKLATCVNSIYQNEDVIGSEWVYECENFEVYNIHAQSAEI